MELMVHVVQQYHAVLAHVNFIVTALTYTCLVSMIIQYVVFITSYYGMDSLCTSTISFSEGYAYYMSSCTNMNII